MTTPITDWNWFFSSLSQSGAALIGIIAAFIISKLLTESEKKERFYQSLRDLGIEREKLLSKIARSDFEKFNERIFETNKDVNDGIRKGHFDNLNDNEIENKLFQLIPNLYYASSNINLVKNSMKKYQEKRFRYKITNFINIIPNLIEDSVPKFDNILSKMMDFNSGDFASIQKDCLDLTKRYKVGKDDIQAYSNNLVSLKIVIFILMFGFIGTVVYPLHFMPMSVHASPHIVFSLSVFWQNLWSIQGILLLFLTGIIEGIFIYFLFLIKSIKNGYDQAKVDIKPECLTLSSYSEYFKNKE